MSAYYDGLCNDIDSRLSAKSSARDGRVIPSTINVALKDEAVKVSATFLYADLAGSSVLSEICPWSTTAKIIKTYLYICSRLISARNGKIRSFDGDRVMGVFMGKRPSNDAVKCAREIDYIVHHALNPKAKARFNSINEHGIEIRHCVGIDHGEARAVRGGIRANNDLLWIGKPPSFAAKLSDIRDYPSEVFISSRVFNRLSEDQKLNNGESLWTKRSFNFARGTENIYSTTSMLAP